MGQNDELDQKLWEFVYDLLPEQDAREVRQRVTSEPEVARAYARVKLQADFVAEAARWDESPVAFQPPADHGQEAPKSVPARRAPISPAHAARVMNWLVGVAASALVCVMGYGYLRSHPSFAPTQDEFARQFVRTEVIAPDRLRPEITNLFSLRTTTLDGAPEVSRVAYRFYDAQGNLAGNGTGTTDQRGWLQIALRRSLVPSVASLEVEAIDAPMTNKVRADLQRGRSELVTHLTLDKPSYYPGETVHFRSVTLSRVALRADREVATEYDVLDDNKQSVWRDNTPTFTQRGVGNGSFEVPQSLAPGPYSLVVHSPEQEFAEVERRFFVQLKDEKRHERMSRPIPNLSPELDVEFYPEGGELVVGLESRVYFRCQNSLNQPTEIAGHILDSVSKEVAQIRTRQAGRGVFSFTPQAENTYSLSLNLPDGAVTRAVLPPVSGENHVVLRAEPSVIEAGESLGVELSTTGSDVRLAIAAYCRGAMVGQEIVHDAEFTPSAQGRKCRTSLPLAPEASGVLRLTVFDYHQDPPAPMAERLVFRHPERKLNLRFTPNESVESPSDKMQLRLSATDEADRPIPAVLGVTVVDGTRPELDAMHSMRLPTYFYLGTEIPRPEELEDANFYLTDTPEAETELDLVLGTQGWRRFVSAPLESLALAGAYGGDLAGGQGGLGGGTLGDPLTRAGKPTSSHGIRGERFRKLPDLSVTNEAPAIYDNADQVQRAFLASQTAREAAWRTATERIARVLVIGGVSVIIAVALLGLLRLSPGVRYGIPVATAACVSLFLGIMWMGRDVDRLGNVAQAPSAETVPYADVRSAGEAPESAGVAVKIAPVQAYGRSTDDLAVEEAMVEDAPRLAAPAPVAQSVSEATVESQPLERGRASATRFEAQRGASATEDRTEPDPARSPIRRRAVQVEGLDERLGRLPAVELAEREMERSAEAGRLILRKGQPARKLEEAKAGEPSLRGYSLGQKLDSAGLSTLRMREYAYQQQSETSANDFVETLYWHPRLVVDEEGQAIVEFDRSDSPINLRLIADGHAEGRLGSLDTVIVAEPAEAAEPE